MSLEITSKENSLYKDLKNKAKEKTNHIFIEGKKLFVEAINSSLEIEKIVIDKKSEHLFVDLLTGKNISEIIYMNNDLIASIFTTDSKPESSELIIALAKRPLYKNSDIFKTKKNIVLLENIQDPGNLGTIIRSALAFDAGGIILRGSTVDPFNTKVIRSSAGAVFKLPVIRVEDINELKELKNKENYKIIATSNKAGKLLSQIKSRTQNIFLFGNEGYGLSKELENIADEIISIPHSKKTESLNLGIAVSIVLWELQRKM